MSIFNYIVLVIAINIINFILLIQVPVVKVSSRNTDKQLRVQIQTNQFYSVW